MGRAGRRPGQPGVTSVAAQVLAAARLPEQGNTEMAGQPPAGDPAPADGSTAPSQRWTGSGAVPFGIYVHVPFCQTRVATATSTPTPRPSWAAAPPASRTPALVVGEVSARGEGDVAGRTGPVQTVFFGGGTPTLLPAADLTAILGGDRRRAGPGRRRRGDRRGQSRRRSMSGCWRAAGCRLHPHLAGHAERRPARAHGAGPGAPARPP